MAGLPRRMQRVLLLYLFLAGCSHVDVPYDATKSGWRSSFAPTCRQSQGGWCVGTDLALAVDEGFPCPEALGVARRYWADRGQTFGHASQSEVGTYGVVSVIFDMNLSARGRTSILSEKQAYKQGVVVRVRDCNPYVLAHELGHVLGYEHDYTRDGIMNVSDGVDGWRAPTKGMERRDPSGETTSAQHRPTPAKSVKGLVRGFVTGASLR